MSLDSTHKTARGDIYYVNFGDGPGSVIHGIRPALIIQNNTANRFSSTVIVAAITTGIKKLKQPTHVMIGKRFGLAKDSMLLLEQIFTIDKTSLIEYIGSASPDFMQTVNKAYALSIGLV